MQVCQRLAAGRLIRGAHDHMLDSCNRHDPVLTTCCACLPPACQSSPLGQAVALPARTGGCESLSQRCRSHVGGHQSRQAFRLGMRRSRVCHVECVSSDCLVLRWAAAAGEPGRAVTHTRIDAGLLQRPAATRRASSGSRI